MLKITEISFGYGNKKILDHFSLSIESGEIVAVMGPSGCGKSTLLNLIAGLKKASIGTIERNTERISYAFQEPRLFPWLTVNENLLAVLPTQDADAQARVDHALSALSLSDAKGLYPHELSGGMKSRISLARALVYNGDLMLLDEPFSALDETLRSSLARTIREECKARGTTVILVTHSLSEANAMADRTITLA